MAVLSKFNSHHLHSASSLFVQNIAWVKSYNICFELEDSNEIFTQLYRTLFQVIK